MPESALVQVGSRALALTTAADNRILSEMVGASLALATESILTPAALDELVREAAPLHTSNYDEIEKKYFTPKGNRLEVNEAGRAEIKKLNPHYSDEDISHFDFRELIDLLGADGVESPRPIKTSVSQDQEHKNSQQLRHWAKPGLNDVRDVFKKMSQDMQVPRALRALAAALAKMPGNASHFKVMFWEWRLPGARWGGKYTYRGEDTDVIKINLSTHSTPEHLATTVMLQAYKWYQLAADQGHKEAKEQAAELAAMMSPRELETAQRLYREFKDKQAARQ
jgi:hypothetical protein